MWNGNSLNPDTLKPEFRPRGDAYVKGIVEAIKDERGLLMWDIMNEPFTNSYYERSTVDEKKQREAEITAFVRYNLSYVKRLDPVNAITVGYCRIYVFERARTLRAWGVSHGPNNTGSGNRGSSLRHVSGP